MATKIFLGINALLFIGYGLVCLVSPSVVADQTGLQLATGVASVEVRAMYGGLQTAVGLLCLAGATRPGLQPGVLLAMVFLFFGLASGRMLGIAIDPELGSYNIFALLFETVFAVISVALLARSRAAAGSQVA